MKFRTQPEDQQITCSAYALINALRQSGNPLPETTENQLISQILDTGKPLEPNEQQTIALQQGFKIEYLKMTQEEELPTAQSLINYVKEEAQDDVTLMLSISSLLSRRDKKGPSLHQQQFCESERGKNVVHAVIMTVRGDLISITDSYNPEEPEHFNTAYEREIQRCSAWICSIFIEDFITTHLKKSETVHPEEIETIGPGFLTEAGKAFRIFWGKHRANIRKLVKA